MPMIERYGWSEPPTYTPKDEGAIVNDDLSDPEAAVAAYERIETHEDLSGIMTFPDAIEQLVKELGSDSPDPARLEKIEGKLKVLGSSFVDEFRATNDSALIRGQISKLAELGELIGGKIDSIDTERQASRANKESVSDSTSVELYRVMACLNSPRIELERLASALENRKNQDQDAPPTTTEAA